MTRRKHLLLPAAFTVGVGLALVSNLSGWGDSHRLPPRARAMAYMRAHPVPPRPGMTVGVILRETEKGFERAAARQAHCPAATLTAAVRGDVGDLPGCIAWHAAVLTRAGTMIHVACGSIAARQLCPLDLHAAGYLPFEGDYVRFRTDGRISNPGDVQPIREFAVNIPVPGHETDPSVTAPASGRPSPPPLIKVEGGTAGGSL